LFIKRQCIETLKNAVSQGSLVVVGDPGIGKSGALFELATGLIDDYDVVFLKVDSLEAKSLGGIRTELGLANDIVDVLGSVDISI
jgi:predicted ATP-dependent serine protease